MKTFNLVHIPINTWAIDRQDLLEVMQQISLPSKIINVFYYIAIMVQTVQEPKRRHVSNYFLKTGQLMQKK